MREIESIGGFVLSENDIVARSDVRYPSQIRIDGIHRHDIAVNYPNYVAEMIVKSDDTEDDVVCMLTDVRLWDSFSETVQGDGYDIYVLPTVSEILRQSTKWSEHLEIKGLTLPPIGDRPGALFPYQEYGLNRALSSPDGFFFFNWGTGAGKGVAAAAGAQELSNRERIDLVYVFTLRKMKINLMREFNSKTTLNAKNIEGSPFTIKGKKFGARIDRHRKFMAEDADVYVMNYEKANFDYDILIERAKGKRVLFILDEVQKILTYTSGTPNLAGKGIRSLIRELKDPIVWPMSASVIGPDPERYWHLFDLPKGYNRLGTLNNFRLTYSANIKTVNTPWGAQITYEWSNEKMREVRYRIAPWTHSVRKSDPDLQALFKDVEFIPIPIQLSPEDRKLYDLVASSGTDDDPDLWGQYYHTLRHICNTAESLKHSKSEIAQILCESIPSLSSGTSSKMEVLIDMVQEIRDQGDKVIVFTEYTNLCLFLIADQFKAKGIRFVLHYGTGMTDAEAQMAQDEFKADPGVTVFLSSDAGSHGLSLSVARYVINYEIPYGYDKLMQRNARIDRADSHLSGLTCFGLYCEGTVEERIFRINKKRMEASASIQGTTEQLSRTAQEEPEGSTLESILFNK